MAEKDPKDMTASELLRLAAKDIDRDANYAAQAIEIVCDVVGSERTHTYEGSMANALEALADKIDAEIEAARGGDVNDTFMMVLDKLITYNSYPSRREGEGFVGWLERCFIQRPRFEDGEPVQFGDSNIDWDYTAECRVPGAWWNATAVDCDGRLLATTFSRIIAVAKTDENGRVKRLATEVLGADGEPIVECETVWDMKSGKELLVSAIANADAGMIQCSDDDGVYEDYDARYITHTPPDSQARIDADAQVSSYDYWGCANVECNDCPAVIDDKKPLEYFDCPNCLIAKMLDLLRRQRELDARKGGAE